MSYISVIFIPCSHDRGLCGFGQVGGAVVFPTTTVSALCETLVVDNSLSIFRVVVDAQENKSRIVAPRVNTVLQGLCGDSKVTRSFSIAGIGTKKYTKGVPLINSTRAMAQATNGVNAASAVAADPKLESMRAVMKSLENGKGVDAFIVPSEDPHMVRVVFF